MKRTKLLVSAFLLLTVVFTFFGCAPKITVDEIKAELPQLIEPSKMLNEIYLGKGYPESKDVSAKEISGYYYCDTSLYGFNSISEIKDATEKIFTPEYANVLYQAAFDGLSTEQAVESARYIESDAGLMQKVNDDVYDLPSREFDYDSVEIVKGGRERVTISIASKANGKNEVIEMIVVRYGEEGNYSYRLDSPTY